MELNTMYFWIGFGTLCFGIFLMLLFFALGALQKKRIEKKLDQIFVEVRDLNLRVTILETRMEERQYSSVLSIPSKDTPKPVTSKRGRPRKNPD